MIGRRALVLAFCVGLLSLPVRDAGAANPFTSVVGFAAKTGYRLVFSWQATRPVAGVVHYGTNAANLDQRANPQVARVDTAQVAIVDRPETDIGSTYYYKVVDLLTGDASAVQTLGARNAYTDFNGSVYTIDLVLQLDSKALPDTVPIDSGLRDLAAAVNVLAERTYDALDGWARIGKVLVTDTNLDNAANVPFTGGLLACAFLGTNLSDYLIQTTVPFDSHTFGGFAISDACTQIHIGRLGWLYANPWQGDTDLGYTMTHELMHYAFNTPDLYGSSTVDCAEPDTWNGSIMHNSGGWMGSPRGWELIELDRNAVRTPCEHGDEPYSWARLRQRYDVIPADPPIQFSDKTRKKGNPDGGALDIWILSRTPGASTLEHFTPNDVS